MSIKDFTTSNFTDVGVYPNSIFEIDNTTSLSASSFLYLHKSIPKIDTIPKICACYMPIEGSWVELGQHEDLVYATVDAVAHRDVYKPVTARNWNLQIIINYHQIRSEVPCKSMISKNRGASMISNLMTRYINIGKNYLQIIQFHFHFKISQVNHHLHCTQFEQTNNIFLQPVLLLLR